MIQFTLGHITCSHATRTIETFDLHPEPPYRLDLTVWALRRRARNEIDRWDGNYARALIVGGRAVQVQVEQIGALTDPTLRVRVMNSVGLGETGLADVRSQLICLLGVDADLREFYELAENNRQICALKDRFLGLRPPRFPGIFEALANAVANQQLSLEVGLTLLNRLTESFGMHAVGGDGLVAFPSADAVLAASPDALRHLGFSARKASYLHDIAHAVATGTLDERELEQASRAGAQERLLEIRGIGRWSAEYVLLRGLGRLEVYPGDDVGARNALRRFFGLDHDPGYDEIADRLQPLGSFAGLLYFHLLLLGLAERGDVTG